MDDVTIEVDFGDVQILSVQPTSTDITLVTGKIRLCGWSLREASGDAPVSAEGSVTSPAAGAVILTTAGLVAGTYDITWTVELAGTLAAADTNNFALFVGGVQVATSVNAPVAGNYPQPTVRVVATAGQTIQVKAIALGTVGAVYSADVSALPANAVAAVVEVRDGKNPVAEIGIPVGGDKSQSYGHQGLKIRSDITLHLVQGTVTGAIYARFDLPG